MSAARLKKGDALEHWRGLKEGRKLKPRAIKYGHEGSTYGHDGVRIEGSREFIDSVLSRLKPLLDCENAETRIGLNYQAVAPRPGKPHSGGDWVCYIKIHERGDEAKAVNGFVSALAGREIIASAGYSTGRKS